MTDVAEWSWCLCLYVTRSQDGHKIFGIPPSFGSQEDGSSIAGFIFKVLTGPVTWCAKK